MGTDRVIYIRTDGNTEIATGHIMRCLTIAKACRKKGADVVFIVSDEESEAILSSRMEEDTYPVMNLHTDYRNAEEELPLFCQLLMSYPCTALLVDSYFVNPGYLDTLSRVTHVAYIDDLCAFPYPVQTVINYDADPDPADDSYRLVPQKLLGFSYTPLREMFARCSYTVRPEIQAILLTAGGLYDGRFFAEMIHTIFRHFSDARRISSPAIHILTDASDICPELSALLESHPDIIRHGYISDMADFLCGFDLVLTASGTTLYEICSLGIPCISFVIADNQIPSAAAFDRQGLVPCIGDLRTDSAYTDVLDKLLTQYADYETRCICSANMTAAIDKKGADRIADALLN